MLDTGRATDALASEGDTSLPIAELLLDDWVLYRVEAVLVVVALLVSLAWPKERPAPFARLDGALDGLRGRYWLQTLIVLAFAIGLRAMLLPILGPPPMFGVDEFSQLFQAQTFALGRLANPTHPLFPFFESIYVNQTPSVASMYFPGRGVPLLLGLLVADLPWLGIWLSMVLLAVATAWMLRAYVSETLALLGALLLVIRFGVLSTMINTHYGAGYIALGGVLVLGAFPRLLKKARWSDAILFGLGLLILMTGRPFEGFFFALPFLAAIAWKLLGFARQREFQPILRIALPIALLTGAGAGLMLSYNAAATGDPLLDAYTHNRQSYAHVSPFWFGELENYPEARPAAQINTFFLHEPTEADSGAIRLMWLKIKSILNFFFGPVLIIPLILGFFCAFRYPITLASTATLMFAFSLSTWTSANYIAPGLGLLWIFVMLGFGQLHKWRLSGRPSGAVLASLLPVIAVVSLAIPLVGLLAGAKGEEPYFTRPCCAVLTETPRSRIEQQLLTSPGKDLVLYRFDPDRDFSGVNIVSNEPDIDRAPIIWAHDLGPANRKLLDYYPDRRVWLVDGSDTDTPIPYDSIRDKFAGR